MNDPNQPERDPAPVDLSSSADGVPFEERSPSSDYTPPPSSESTPPPSASRDQPPQILRIGEGTDFGDFRLIKELGRGGMGIVYLALEQHLNRKLAVKILPHGVASDPKVVERFVREARAAARLRHPNIIPIYSAGEIDGTHYYTMEYVPGISLAQILAAMREHRLYHKGWLSVRRYADEHGSALRLVTEGSASGGSNDPAQGGEKVLSFAMRNYVHEALALFAGVADALSFAHEGGVVHRDIKPSNLLLAPDGRLLVADFGLAKVGDARGITRTGDLVGSPSYMSPEQTMTGRVRVDHRSDIWSLGVTLYEFLTLRHPFEARNLEVSLSNIQNADPRPPRELNSRLPKDVDTIIMMCLQKNPDRRYQTASDLAADLRSVLRYESIQARSASPIQIASRFMRRHITRLAIGLLVTSLLVVGGFAIYLQRESKFADVELSIAYFNGAMASLGNVDRDLAREVQAELRHYRRDSTDLRTAIDRYAVATLSEAEAKLPTAASAGEFKSVVRELEKLRLILHHTRDLEALDRMERLDRATADIRVRLVWALSDSIADISPGIPGVPEGQRFRWLRHFLGLDGETEGMLPEKNPFVRRNAVLALGTLAAHPRFGEEVVELMLELTHDDSVGSEVQGEAVKVLAGIERVRLDQNALDYVRKRLLSPRNLPELARLRAIELFASSPHAPRYRELFERFALDPVEPIAKIARGALQ